MINQPQLPFVDSIGRGFGGCAVAQNLFQCVARGDRTGKDVWVAYKNPEEIALTSSQVVLGCKRTGRVLDEGAAGDEG